MEVKVSFFTDKVVGGVLSKIGGEAFMTALKVMTGSSSDTEIILKKVNAMSAMISDISAKVDAIPSKVAFVDKFQACENKISAITNLLYKIEDGESITKSQWLELVNFVKEGTEGNDYYSLTDRLFNAAYGRSLVTCYHSPDSYFWEAGKSEHCYAYGLNRVFLNQPIGITDYIQRHVNFAASLYAMIAAVVAAAQKSFNVLKTELEKGSHATDVKEIVKEAIDNKDVHKSLFDPQLGFIWKYRSYILLAFQSEHLTGFAYQLYEKLSENSRPVVSIYNGLQKRKKNIKLYPISRTLEYRLKFEEEDTKGWRLTFENQEESKVKFLSLNDREREYYLGVSSQSGNMGGRIDYIDIQVRPYTWELLLLFKNDYGTVYLLRDKDGKSMDIQTPFFSFLGSPKARYSKLDSNDEDYYWYLEFK